MTRSRFGIFRNERNRSTHWTLNSCFGVFRTNLVLSGPFGCLQNSVQNGPNWCKISCHEVALDFFAMNAPDPPHWTLDSCFGVFVQFWCIWDRLVALRNTVQNGPNWCKSSCHEVTSEFFAMKAPDPPHWTLNSCFGAFVQFGCIWHRLVDLRNSVQNGPNWFKSSCHEVTSEFCQMNAPDPPHWTLNSCFGAFVQFWCILDCLVDLRNSVQNEPN